MKIRRVLFKPAVFLAALAAGMAWWGNTPAQAQGVWSTTLVPIAGIVTGQPENVEFSGLAKVHSKLAPDPDFYRPTLLLSIDLSAMTGVGSSTRNKYTVAGPENVQRSVAGSHFIEFTFAFASIDSTNPASEQARGDFSRRGSGLDNEAINLDFPQSGLESPALGFERRTGTLNLASVRSGVAFFALRFDRNTGAVTSASSNVRSANNWR